MPIDGRYPALAKVIRHLLGWEKGSPRPYLTTRGAQRKTGISHVTITTAACGDRPSVESLIQIATELGGDAHDLVALCYPDHPILKALANPIRELTREPLFEQLSAGWAQLSPAAKQRFVEEIKAEAQLRERGEQTHKTQSAGQDFEVQEGENP